MTAAARGVATVVTFASTNPQFGDDGIKGDPIRRRR